jgi:capsular polysaccharide biosynthesis protein
MLAERDLEVTPREVRTPVRRWRLPTHWPLSVALLGFPLWWALGLRTILPMLLALVMADQLLRRRRLVLPGGFAVWAMYLAWLFLGLFVLFADAPGAVPGGDASRLLVFGYRGAWYLTATIALLWVTNLSEEELPTRWLYQLLGFMFLVTTVGGLAGVLAPNIEFTSLVESLLPRGLRGNSLVQSMVHPAVADLQNVLGRPEARPKAPFPFANSWGSNLALFLPFFLVAWFRHGPRWQRLAGPIVLVLAAIPIVYSLNRGLWVCLVLGAAGLVWLQLGKGRLLAVVSIVVVLVAAVLALALSPLGGVFQERLDNQHSNERRGQLLTQTWNSTVEGSPVVGFGSTRDVQGSFASIAGASTPDCGPCGVPPLGTQGHIWQLIFSQGIVGAVLFLSFFALVLSRCWRCRTTTETLSTFVLAFFGLLLPIYDTLGMPLFTVMLVVGLVAREQQARAKPGSVESLESLDSALARLRRRWPILAVTTLVGAMVGAVIAVNAPVEHAARVSILLAASPVSLDLAETDDGASVPEEVTIDTEAALLISRETLSRVVGSTDAADLEALRRRVRVTAVPSTRVLTVEVRSESAERSRVEANALAESYIETRRGHLSTRRDQTLSLLRTQLAKLRRSTPPGTPADPTRTRLEGAVTTILLTPTSAGEVIRATAARAVRRQSEVPVTSGAALGLATGALLLAMFPGWRSVRPNQRRREQDTWTSR